MIIELKSVQCQIDTDTLRIARIMKDTIKRPFHGIEVHIDDVPEDWYYRLDDEDYITVENIILNSL